MARQCGLSVKLLRPLVIFYNVRDYVHRYVTEISSPTLFSLNHVTVLQFLRENFCNKLSADLAMTSGFRLTNSGRLSRVVKGTR